MSKAIEDKATNTQHQQKHGNKAHRTQHLNSNACQTGVRLETGVHDQCNM